MDKSPDNQRSVTCHPWVNESLVLWTQLLALSWRGDKGKSLHWCSKQGSQKLCNIWHTAPEAWYIIFFYIILNHFKSRSWWCKCITLFSGRWGGGIHLFARCITVHYLYKQQKQIGNKINELSMHKKSDIHSLFIQHSHLRIDQE